MLSRTQIASISAAAATSLLLACHAPASAAPKKRGHVRHVDISFIAPVDAESSPAFRYGQLDGDACEAQLVERGIGFTRVSEARGVLAPVRLSGTLHGVLFHMGRTPKDRATSPFEILDCRLVLALDDFAELLARRGVVEVIHYSMYRPPPKGFPEGALGSRHPGGLALDAAVFRKADGTTLDVLRDFHGWVGAMTCGSKASPPHPASPAALELRAIVCEAAEKRIFNVALTPNYNRPHRNHFHLEVTPNARWFIVH